MTFTRPKVGAKVYLSKGPSGHSETFERNRCDNELELFLGGSAARMHIAVEGFLRKMLLDRKIEGWSEIIEYLAEWAGFPNGDLVPINIAVAFWAKCDESRLASKAKKLETAHAGN